MNKMNAFMKEFVAIIKGDDAEAKAAKVWRQAESGLKVQIANLEGDIINKEDAVLQAEENLANARVNYGKEITDRRSYVQNLLNAQDKLNDVTAELEAHKSTITFLKEQYDKLKAE